MEGMTDLMIFLVPEFGGLVLHVELKASDGRLSDSQAEWRDELARFGHETHYVAHSADALCAILRHHGVPVMQWWL